MYVKKFDKMGIDEFTTLSFPSEKELLNFLENNPNYALHWDNEYLWELNKIYVNGWEDPRP